jgi:hypothetical protein
LWVILWRCCATAEHGIAQSKLRDPSHGFGEQSVSGS